MINRYLGNSGAVQRLPSPGAPAPQMRQRQSPPAPGGNSRVQSSKPQSQKPQPQIQPSKPRTGENRPVCGQMQRQPAGVSGREKPGGLLKSIASGFDLSRLETEDIILLLILYLLYRESGDEDMLIMMGALFFS